MTIAFGEYPQDTIKFDVTEEHTLTNNTVLIAVPVNAIRQEAQDEDTFRSQIKETLRRFIDADWNFGAIVRSETAAGVEGVQLVATARVSEKENYNLTSRARQVGTRGLQLDKPVCDYRHPNVKVEEGKRELRRKLLAAIDSEREAITKATGRNWRLGDVAFGQQFDVVSNRKVQATSFAATYSSDGEQGEDLTHSTKLVMTATVTLVNSDDSPR